MQLLVSVDKATTLPVFITQDTDTELRLFRYLLCAKFNSS